MNCKNTLKILIHSSELDCTTKEIIAAKEHLLSCTICRAIFEDQKILQNLICEKAPKYKTPQGLKENIINQIKKNYQHKSFKGIMKRRVALPVALSIAFVIIIVLLSYVIINESKAHNIVNTITNQHIQYSTGTELLDVSSTNSQDIELWFKDKMDFHLKIPNLNGANIIGGRLCKLFDKPAAVLLYKNQEELISLFIFDNPDLDIYSMDMLNIDGKRLCRGNGKGVNLVLWEDKGLIYALVSPLKEMELLKLASISSGSYE